MVKHLSYKKNISLLVLINLLLCNTSFISAGLHEFEPWSPYPFELAPCVLYTFHQMMPSSAGHVYDKDTRKNLFSGGLYKCRCGAIVICKGRPEYGSPIGKYITTTERAMGESFKKQPWYVRWLISYIWPAFNIAYVTPSEIYYTKSNLLMGYRFIPISY